MNLFDEYKIEIDHSYRTLWVAISQGNWSKVLEVVRKSSKILFKKIRSDCENRLKYL